MIKFHNTVRCDLKSPDLVTDELVVDTVAPILDDKFVSLPKSLQPYPWYMMTNIYHISYAARTKEVSLFFWGCNFRCQGCLCKKESRNFLLKENMHLFSQEPDAIARPPDRFLYLGEVIGVLDKLDVRLVLLEGQEASLDPMYPTLTEILHERYGTRNILCSNIYKKPPLKDTDAVTVGLKAFTDSLHRHYTGKSNREVQEHFVELYRSGMQLSVTSLFVPGYIDTDETERIARFIASVDEDIPYVILPYFKAGNNPWRRPTPEEMEDAESVARRHLNKVHAFKGDEEMEYEVARVI